MKYEVVLYVWSFCVNITFNNISIKSWLSVAVFAEAKSNTRRTSHICHCTLTIFLIKHVFIEVYCCPTQLPCQVMLMSVNTNTTGATNGAGTVYPLGTPEFTMVLCACSCCSIFSFMCSFFNRSLFVFQSFFL